MATKPNGGGDLVAQADLIEATVFRGTYVTEEGSVGPGGTIKVDAEELKRLKRIGTVKPDDFAEPQDVQDGTLKLTSEGGPAVSS